MNANAFLSNKSVYRLDTRPSRARFWLRQTKGHLQACSSHAVCMCHFLKKFLSENIFINDNKTSWSTQSTQSTQPIAFPTAIYILRTIHQYYRSIHLLVLIS